jgi:LPXTG-motif cell wall-anchored protein
MKHWLILAAVYALVAALVLPGSLLAQDGAPAAGPATAGEESASPESAPEPGAPATNASAPSAPAPNAPTSGAPATDAPAAPARAEPAPPAEQAPAAAVPAEPAPTGEQPDPAAASPAPRPLGDEHRGKPRAVAAADTSVTIVDFEFGPAQITIQQGDTVTWRNDGPTPHSATAPDGSFDTGIFPDGESRSHTFGQAGSFSYICTPHPNMKGTVTVEASGDTSTGSGETGAGSGSTDSGSTAARSAESGSTGSDSAGSTDSGSSLPDTGADAAALAILGVLLLALGFAIQRRSGERAPRPAGRIGW